MSTAAEKFGAAREDRGLQVPAGPFEAVPPAREAPGLNDALMTGLLVIYPAFAVVAAIIAGLTLFGS